MRDCPIYIAPYKNSDIKEIIIVFKSFYLLRNLYLPTLNFNMQTSSSQLMSIMNEITGEHLQDPIFSICMYCIGYDVKKKDIKTKEFSTTLDGYKAFEKKTFFDNNTLKAENDIYYFNISKKLITVLQNVIDNVKLDE